MSHVIKSLNLSGWALRRLEEYQIDPDAVDTIITQSEYPPILVYQMGKVGSKTVFATLNSMGLTNPIRHMHHLSDKGFDDLVWKRKDEPAKEAVRLGIKLRNSLVELTKTTRRIYVISLTREPIITMISAVFENLDNIGDFVDKDGKIRDAEWFNLNQVEYVDEGVREIL